MGSSRRQKKSGDLAGRKEEGGGCFEREGGDHCFKLIYKRKTAPKKSTLNPQKQIFKAAGRPLGEQLRADLMHLHSCWTNKHDHKKDPWAK